MAGTKLLDAVDANGAGEQFILARGGASHVHQTRAVFVWGTDLDGGNVAIQVSPDRMTVTAANSSWFTARTTTGGQATFTVFDVQNIVARAAKIRAVLAGGGASIDAITAELY